MHVKGKFIILNYWIFITIYTFCSLNFINFPILQYQCIYAETREAPIGSEASRLEAKPRQEIVSDCKAKCATSKEQLLLGEPKARKK